VNFVDRQSDRGLVGPLDVFLRDLPTSPRFADRTVRELSLVAHAMEFQAPKPSNRRY
jgi:hypothetical protein